ncbi:DedA family protein [Pseudodonghicola flavimaris]|uniref:VTT domain-containing protein n=1 Tax=Pseudodonghicola flavimaris TaxID=3050036 RepID=A0ABT7F1E3_9RHOB|nr:VTT domain-containing protein [Pseudodonghicola flavimaris]MDK3018423.1 VTT domain-containing protein [Pseudodonghicola flavimaris]
MLGLESIAALIGKYGLALVAPVAVVEGPIVTVIAAWLASTGRFALGPVIVVVILADLLGDFLAYALGRWGLGRLPEGWRRRLGLRPARVRGLAGHFAQKGGRTLILGKLTHSMGLPVLVAAGTARMRIALFLWYNLLGTVPKSLFFVALGYGFGAAYGRIDDWIGRISLILLVGLLVTIGCWIFYRKWHK